MNKKTYYGGASDNKKYHKDFKLALHKRRKIDAFFAFTILALCGWSFCLPVGEEIPFWKQPIQLVYGVFIHEAFFIGYLLFRFFKPNQKLLQQPDSFIALAARTMIILAVWCAIPSLFGSRPFYDVAESARLVLLAILLIIITQWAVKSPVFVLRVFIIGLVGGTLVNLVSTLAGDTTVIGVIPMLMGQNGPGTSMGIAVCLSAWLALISERRLDTILAYFATLACGFGAAISYSKIGMGAGILGFCSMTFVILFKSKRTGGSFLRRSAIIVCSIILMFFTTGQGAKINQSLSQIFELKSGSLELTTDISKQQNYSNSVRTFYYLVVRDIVLKHPFGVGYSGFLDAMISSDTYRENPINYGGDDEQAENSNPHSTLLYYSSAGGIIAGGLSLFIILSLCIVMVKGLKTFGLVGVFVGILTGLAFLIPYLTVPTLHNTSLMLVPSAVAVGCLYHRKNTLNPKAIA